MYGIEKCPKTDKLHLQGLCITENALSFNSIKKKLTKLFDSTIHIEKMNSNFDKNLKYCSKGGDIVSIGDAPKGAGSRSDIQNIISLCRLNSSISDIIDKVNINYQTLKFTENIQKYLEPPRKIEKLDVFWIYGDSGVGKTSWVYKNYNDVFRPITEKWWEGYDGHKTVLLDDIRVQFCSFPRLLQLLDIYPFKVETKGGSRQVQYDTIIITAPESSVSMWSNETKEDIQQLTRRITQEWKMEQRSISNTKLLTDKLLTVEF